MKASKGFRHRTRKRLKGGKRQKMKPNSYLGRFDIGQCVVIAPFPASHKGMPHPRFVGLTGTVLGQSGRAYLVAVRQGGKIKKLYSRPEHLKPVK